jgi:hypothetical protein
MIDWLFRSRRTGRITVFQLPNVALWIFIAAAVLGRLVDWRVVKAVAAGALVWWAVDEVLRGENPFRRLLGAAVLAFTVAGLVR